MGITVGGILVVTVVGTWRGGLSVQGGQTQPPTSPWEYMDLRAGPERPEQVEWIHLSQRLHWIEVCPTSRERMEHVNLGLVGRTTAGPGLGWMLPLASKRRRRDKRESKIEFEKIFGGAKFENCSK